MTILGKWLRGYYRPQYRKQNGGSSLWSDLSDWAKNVVDTVFKSSAVSNWVKGTTGSALTNAQIQQNDWNASEADKQRQFELESDSTKFQRQVADMQAAGLNPALMYGSSVSSAGSVSGQAASGSASPAPSGGLLDSILSVIFAKERLHNLRYEGEVLKSQANKNDADAELARSNRALADTNTDYVRMLAEYYPRLTETNISRISQEIERSMSEIDVNTHRIANIDSDTALKDTQSFVESLRASWIDRLNSAKTYAERAAAVNAFADAAMKQYTLQFAKDHDGQLPGYNQWLGVAAALSGVFNDLGWSDNDKTISEIDWRKFFFEPFGHWKEIFGKKDI